MNFDSTFQSAPPTRVRGGRPVEMRIERTLRFQSTPCTEVQGDLQTRSQQWLYPCFNPLPAPKYREIVQAKPDGNLDFWFQSAPCTEVQGDVIPTRLLPFGKTFQSAPCTEVQGDLSAGLAVAGNLCFNPLPQPELGEMSIFQSLRGATYVSIRSPNRS